MPETSRAIAIFDLDYTLTKRGTWGRFVWQWVRFRPHVWLPLLISAGWVQWRYKRGTRPRVDVKRAMMRWAMKGAPKDKVILKGQQFAKREIEAGLRLGALDAVQAHKSNGDILIMISAAADVVAKPIGELLGFDDVIATEMSFDDCNKLTLNFKTPNCYGVEKTNRYNDLLNKKEDLKQCNTQVTFYSDSYSDLAMFNLAHVKVAVHPDRKLTQHAVEKGWKIVRW